MKQNAPKFKIVIIGFFASLLLITYSCEELQNGISKEEIVEGLKTALKVGTDTSTSVLSAVNGYYGDQDVKIPLPEEVENIRTSLKALKKKSLSIGDAFKVVDDQLFENVVKGVNKAAESGANEAAPIFGDAITDLSIDEAWDILNGTNPADTATTKSTSIFDSTAATAYFKSTTKPALIDVYAPKIDKFLDQDLGLGFSANEAYNTLKDTYNGAYDNATLITGSETILSSYGLTEITTSSIGEFSTDKALNGLFLFVGREERNIRRDPLEWASTAVGNILEKVFGEEHDQPTE